MEWNGTEARPRAREVARACGISAPSCNSISGKVLYSSQPTSRQAFIEAWILASEALVFRAIEPALCAFAGNCRPVRRQVPESRRRVPRGWHLLATCKIRCQPPYNSSPFFLPISSVYPSPSCLLGTGTHCMTFISRVRLFSKWRSQSFITKTSIRASVLKQLPKPPSTSGKRLVNPSPQTCCTPPNAP